MRLIDTHAHIHFDEFKDILPAIFLNAKESGVETIVCVGTDDEDSRRALNFVTNPEVLEMADGIKLFATAGIHPHEASLGGDGFLSIKELAINSDYTNVLVGIGECGLDYYKNISSVEEQKEICRWQIDLANQLQLPLVFHVRDAWDDFFEIIKYYPKLRGVIHSFTGDESVVKRAAKYELYFGLNGIMTFTKDEAQLMAVARMPKDRIVLETDCPYLAPVPMRGKQNEPSFIKYTYEFISGLRNEDSGVFFSQVNANANKLFKLEN